MSKKIILENYNELEAVKEDGYRLGSGAFGTCYLMPNGFEVYKLFDDTEIQYYYDLKFFDHLLDVKNDSYVFPENLIYVKDKIIGYSMRYVFGQTLTNCFEKIKLSNLPKFISKLEIDTKKISDSFIKTSDIALRNTIVNKKGFYFIDTDDYLYSDWRTPDKVYEENQKQIRSMLMTEIAKNYSEINLYIKEDKVMQFIMRTMKNDSKASLVDFFVYLEILANKVADVPITTFSDLKKIKVKSNEK